MRFTVKTSYDQSVMGNYFIDSITENFLQSVFKVDKYRFLGMLEGFATSGLISLDRSTSVPNANARKNALKIKIRKDIAESLCMSIFYA